MEKGRDGEGGMEREGWRGRDEKRRMEREEGIESSQSSSQNLPDGCCRS